MASKKVLILMKLASLTLSFLISTYKCDQYSGCYSYLLQEISMNPNIFCMCANKLQFFRVKILYDRKFFLDVQRPQEVTREKKTPCQYHTTYIDRLMAITITDEDSYICIDRTSGELHILAPDSFLLDLHKKQIRKQLLF